jgi:hypothetical protein
MPPTPIEIQMPQKNFKFFPPNFGYYFHWKREYATKKTFLLFWFFLVCVKFNFTPKYNGWLKTPQKFKGSRVLQILTWQETTSSSQHPHLLNTFFGFTLIPRHLLTILLTNIEIKRWGSARIKHSNIALILVHLFSILKGPPPLHGLF